MSQDNGFHTEARLLKVNEMYLCYICLPLHLFHNIELGHFVRIIEAYLHSYIFVFKEKRAIENNIINNNTDNLC